MTGARLAEFSSLEPIDAHTHVGQTSPAFVAMLQRLHMHVLDILYVDDHRPYHVAMEPQRQNALSFIDSATGHAWLCTTFDPFQLNSPDFSRNAIAGLNQDFAHGAVAAKMWKNIGMEIKNPSGQYVMLDDPRFEPIYRDIAAQKKTLIIHAADPEDAAWNRQYLTTPSASYFTANPEWDMSRRPDAPRKQTILDARDHVLAMNPDLRVIGAHLGSMEDDLNGLADRLDRYPNFAVDVAARVEKLGREPRHESRCLLPEISAPIRTARIFPLTHNRATRNSRPKYGNGATRLIGVISPQVTSSSMEIISVQGLDLPREVLKKLYHDNAGRWIPGTDADPR